MSIKLMIFVLWEFLKVHDTSGQMRCKQQMILEWNLYPKTVTVKWILTENICTYFYRDCWWIEAKSKGSTLGNEDFRVPQICPLQLQLGDSLFISSEPSFQSHGINLMNVSKEDFNNCSPNSNAHSQIIFGCNLRGIHQVNSQWLGVGSHYFVTVQSGGPSLCNFGLRLNITVKAQSCQESPNGLFCSGHGRCLSWLWDEDYACHCLSPYSGKFCQEFDPCFHKPCHNHGVCMKKKEGFKKDSYECSCLHQFAGKKLFRNNWTVS
uniref:EGF-like domain-containing protein n=1 Tax=Ornithorhynchus anatinus TaxID=9258 RepID=A0A6I8P8I5_ORNAN